MRKGARNYMNKVVDIQLIRKHFGRLKSIETVEEYYRAVMSNPCLTIKQKEVIDSIYLGKVFYLKNNGVLQKRGKY